MFMPKGLITHHYVKESQVWRKRGLEEFMSKKHTEADRHELTLLIDEQAREARADKAQSKRQRKFKGKKHAKDLDVREELRF